MAREVRRTMAIQDGQVRLRGTAAGAVTLFLCGDVMTGRGIDQILPHPSAPQLFEPSVRSALTYVELAELRCGQDSAAGELRLHLGRHARGARPSAPRCADRESRDLGYGERRVMALQGHQLPHAPGQCAVSHRRPDRLLRAREQSRARLGTPGSGGDIDRAPWSRHSHGRSGR